MLFIETNLVDFVEQIRNTSFDDSDFDYIFWLRNTDNRTSRSAYTFSIHFFNIIQFTFILLIKANIFSSTYHIKLSKSHYFIQVTYILLKLHV